MIKLSVTTQPGRLELDKRLLRATMRSAGAEVAAVARSLIRQSGAGKGKAHRTSAPGQAPSSVSGLLARSITVRPYKSGEGVTVRDTAFYALFLQAGARGGGGNTRNRANILPAGQINGRGRLLRGQNRMKRSAISKTRVLQPRPFLTTALAMREASIARRVADAINSGLKFQRLKP